MNFKLFIYYSALCGAWAAFAAWLVIVAFDLNAIESDWLKTILLSGVVGLTVAAAVGFTDAYLNLVGSQRLVRTFAVAGLGLLGGAFGGVLGQSLKEIGIPNWVGWIFVGLFVGGAVGVLDLLRELQANRDVRASRKKMLNGLLGGLVGGLIGGVLFALLSALPGLTWSPLAIGFVLLGLCIGLMIGLAQVFLKEAWLRIEQGRRAGREMLLTKDRTTIGRAETCDVGLFGEQGIEKIHARIVLHRNRYFIEDVGTSEGTFVNEVRVERAAPLKTGDAIRLGSAVLRFGEREKKG